MTPRAVRLLAEADLIAAEDTRVSRKLLTHFGIATEMVSLHEHNEREQIPRLLAQLRQGKSIALISDAGTPLVSDPGYQLVRAVRAEGIAVAPVPGACAAVAALSASGLPSDRFAFEGFPPAREAARRQYYRERARDPRTLIFYESPHRIEDSLADMAAEFGDGREAAIARELTKKFETIRAGSLKELIAWLAREPAQRRGEFVVLVHGAPTRAEGPTDAEVERVLKLLLAELPTGRASELAAHITGRPRNRLYRLALELARKRS